jgi:hypothetical protein
VNTENEKAVRDPMRDDIIERLMDSINPCLDYEVTIGDVAEAISEINLKRKESATYRMILDQLVDFLGEIPYGDIAGTVAALQSQSNTDGWVMVPVEPTEEMLLAGYEGQGEATCPAVRDAYRAMLSAAPKAPQQVSNTRQDGSPDQSVYNTIASRYFASPPQQEQSGEAVVWGVFWDDSGPLRLAHGWKLPVFKEKEAAEQFAYDVRIAEDGGPAKVLPLGLLSPDTPTATASQESAPGQEVVVETVARVFRDPELGVRVEWLIEGGAGACLDQVLLASPTKLTNDEGYGTVYLATPTSTAIAASSPSNKIAEQHEPGS